MTDLEWTRRLVAQRAFGDAIAAAREATTLRGWVRAVLVRGAARRALGRMG